MATLVSTAYHYGIQLQSLVFLTALFYCTFLHRLNECGDIACPPWSESIFHFPSITAGPRLAVITTRSVRSRWCLLELSWYRWHFSGHGNYGDVGILTNVGMVQSMIHGIVTRQFSLMWQ
jgi:hypothetical protein